MTTVCYAEHQENVKAFESANGISHDVECWSFEQGEDFAEFIIEKYGVVSYDDYHVDTEPSGFSDFEHDCMTMGHDF